MTLSHCLNDSFTNEQEKKADVTPVYEEKENNLKHGVDVSISYQT